MGQELVDDRALSDGGDDAGAAATAFAVQNVERRSQQREVSSWVFGAEFALSRAQREVL